MVVSFYTSRVVLQSLGVDDYGIYNVVGGMVVMFQMLNSTLASATQRFITFALGKGDDNNLKRVFSTSLTLHIILAGILVILIECAGTWLLYNELKIPDGRLSVAFGVLQFSIATLFFNVISVPYNAVIIAHEKMSAFAYISIVEGLLKLVVALLLFFSSFDKLILYALLMFIVSVLIIYIYSSYSHRMFEETRKVSFRIERKLFKEMFGFAGWSFLGNASMVLRNQGVDILLNTQFGVVVNAAKGVANQVDNAIYQFVGNFQTAVIPQVTKSVAQNDLTRTYSLVCNTSRYSFMLLSLFAVPIMFCIDTILGIWLTTVPDWSAAFIRLTLVYLLCDTMSRLLVNTVLASGNIKNYQIVVAGTKFLALPLCYIILKMGGNPATGILVNILLEFICIWERLYFNKKLLDFPVRKYIKTVLVRCWLTFAVAMMFSYLFYRYISEFFFSNLFISGIVVVLCITLIGIDKSERRLAYHYAIKKLSK